MDIQKRYDLLAMAYAEASAVLRESMNKRDLPKELSEEEESCVREFIRGHITLKLEETSIMWQQSFKHQKARKRSSIG